MENGTLFTLLCAGVGYLLTDHFARLLQVLDLMHLYDGEKAARTALLGLGIGALTALCGHSPTELGYWLATANGLVWTVVGGFYHSAALAFRRPHAYARYAFEVDHLRFFTSDAYEDMMTNPVRLQAYLDRTYGKGLVNANEELKRFKKTSKLSTTGLSAEGAQKAIARLNRSAQES